MDGVRIYGMPACRMASSEAGMFGDGTLEKFEAWFSALPETMFPRDFLWYDEKRMGFVWYYMLGNGVPEPDGFAIVDFPGGLYAVATGIDGRESDAEHAAIRSFIENAPSFEIDPTRSEFGDIITPKAAQTALGYCQMDYYVPIRIKTSEAKA